MDSDRIHSHLETLGLAADQPPEPAMWRAFLERLRDDRLDDQLRQSERNLEAVVEMQSRLLSTPGDHLGAFNHVLAPLGQATGAARVYLFENHRRPEDGALLLSQRAEWCAPGITPEIDNPILQGLPYDDFVPEWSAALEHGERVERLAAEFNEVEAALLVPQGVLSLLVIPLTVDGAFTGFIGFDNCTSEVRWSPIEVNLLSAAATQIGLTLAQRGAQRQLQISNAALREQIDTVGRQQAQILRLSAPVLRVWRGVVVVPLVGSIDDAQIGLLSERLLQTLCAERARVAILDLTGLDIIDAATGSCLHSIVGAVRLIGVRCYITGVRPALAVALVEYGVHGLVCFATLADGLAEVLAR